MNTALHEYPRSELQQRLIHMFEQWLNANGASIAKDVITVKDGTLAQKALEELYSGKNLKVISD